jgi:hypothetical protein
MILERAKMFELGFTLFTFLVGAFVGAVMIIAIERWNA